MDELWKPIVIRKNGVLYDYSGYYEVSNTGKVKNVRSNLILKLRITTNGYYSVLLSKNGNQTPFRVHRLVGTMFLDNSKKLPQINHKDGNKLNNVVTNLEWCTCHDNLKHAFDNLLVDPKIQYHKELLGAEAVSIKVNQYTIDGEFIKTHNSIEAAGKSVGLTTGVRVREACRDKRFLKTAGGYKWRYCTDTLPLCVNYMQLTLF